MCCGGVGRGRVTPERGLLVLLDYRWPRRPFPVMRISCALLRPCGLAKGNSNWVDRLTAGGRVLEDTKAKGRPALFTFGSRPLPGGLCVGVEEALASMRAGKRLPHASCLSCVCPAPSSHGACSGVRRKARNHDSTGPRDPGRQGLKCD